MGDTPVLDAVAPEEVRRAAQEAAWKLARQQGDEPPWASVLNAAIDVTYTAVLTALADDEATTQRWEQVAADAVIESTECYDKGCPFCATTGRAVVAAIKAELRREGQ